MDMGIVAVGFLFICGCLAGLAVMIRSAQYAGAGILAVLMIVGIMLCASAIPERNPKVDILKSEIADLRAKIELIQDMANNPAYLVGFCMLGASVLVGLVFGGVYFLIRLNFRHREKMCAYQADMQYPPVRIWELPEEQKEHQIVHAIDYRRA